MKSILLIFIMLLVPISATIANAPQLVDIVLTGSQQALVLEPSDLQLEVGQEYLFVISNPKEFNVAFHYGEFGQSVSTQLMQGTSHVNSEGFTLLPQSKLLWYFVTMEKGEYPFSASDPSLNQAGSMGKIIVKAPIESPKENSENPESLGMAKIPPKLAQQKKTPWNRSH